MQNSIERAIQILKKYDQLNAQNGVTWNGPELMAGFVGDVGDLSKLLMAKHGLRGEIDNDIDAQIAHELADCLWSVYVLAEKYNVDLESAFLKTMDELDERLNKQLVRN